jgi:hypothetical protein
MQSVSNRFQVNYSSEIQGGSPSGGGNGSYTSQGIRLGSSGYISSQKFYIDTIRWCK